MSQAQLLIDAVEALERCGVGYMLTGSFASSLQGEPRATHDVDIVVEVDFSVVEALAAAFGAERFYFDGIGAREALANRTMFNLIDTSTGDKVDFWAITDDPFDQSRFLRRQVVLAFGRPIAVSAPEDTILQKLKWSVASGGSSSQQRDALGVYEVQRDRIDEAYLDEWAARLEVTELLTGLRDSSRETTADE